MDRIRRSRGQVRPIIPSPEPRKIRRALSPHQVRAKPLERLSRADLSPSTAPRARDHTSETYNHHGVLLSVRSTARQHDSRRICYA